MPPSRHRFLRCGQGRRGGHRRRPRRAGAAASGRRVPPVSAAVSDFSGLDDRVSHRVVPNFIGELPPLPAAGAERLKGLPREPFLLYFGDVTEDKGVGWLLDAYRELESPPPLVLIGRQLLEGAGSVPGVVALDPMPHALVVEAVRRSLFTVTPSLLPESFGIVALEAAAAGKPTVASALGGLLDVVLDGETGILVRAGDRGALRDALSRLCAEPETRARMGERARLRAREFGPDTIVPRFEDAYRVAVAARLNAAASRSR